MTTDRSAPPALLWLRRELRLHDNRALAAALASGRPVLPVFVLDETTPGAWAPGGASRWWLHHSLASLADGLAGLGTQLVLRRGRIVEQLRRLVGETGAVELHAGQPIEPWARAVATELAQQLGIPVHLHRTLTLFDPDAIRTQSGGGYGVFSPFARACRAAHPTDAVPPDAVLAPPPHILAPPAPASDRLADWGLLPTRPDWAGGLRETWQPGEAAARQRLTGFAEAALHGYAADRNRPGHEGTSRLSPYLHWGEVSPDTAWRAASHGGDGKGTEAWQNELLWREFSAHLLWHHPTLPEQPLRPEFAAMPWRDDPDGAQAWRHGRTGIPIVDAGMRQVWHTGWMHNRVRMIVASFLVKHLLLPWQLGEAWFWDTLVDADLASNSAQWQWVAGCGADAAPYFRIFNPVLQGFKFDTEGAYVRRWVPELAQLPNAHLHTPWEAPELELAAAGVRLGDTYPRPIVDLAAGRQRALEALSVVTAGRQ